MKLLTESNPKVQKGTAFGYLTAILHFAPSTLSGILNACPYATEGCINSCLNKAGRGGIIKKGETSNAIQEARIARTRFFASDRAGFVRQLSREIDAHARRAKRHGLKPAIRPNGTSDISWELVAPELFARHAAVVFYDYTKGTHRFSNGHQWRYMPANYHLTLSRSEINEGDCLRVLGAGHNAAAVFRDRLPESYKGFPVINADAHDLRFLDARGVWCGLVAKGPARHDRSGFVID